MSAPTLCGHLASRSICPRKTQGPGALALAEGARWGPPGGHMGYHIGPRLVPRSPKGPNMVPQSFQHGPRCPEKAQHGSRKVPTWFQILPKHSYLAKDTWPGAPCYGLSLVTPVARAPQEPGPPAKLHLRAWKHSCRRKSQGTNITIFMKMDPWAAGGQKCSQNTS